ncbi:MAG: response regulator [Planctomycetes bacterium]|nr:response regulator [Planctomycetota bacterium]
MVAARRILVVDDEPVVTKSCRRILLVEGHQVETAESGQEGLRQALSQPFDLVMADLRMPDLDGMELVRAVRKDRPQTAIIIITGFGTITSAVTATKLGVSEYIEKPFTPDQIVEAVNKALLVPPAAPEVQADKVRAVLRVAAQDPSFGARVLAEGSRVLSGFALGDRAEAAIVSGDIAWIEKQCGELSPQERQWLQQRLEAEVW